jgi:2-methylcitrate dehydratase PrpD
MAGNMQRSGPRPTVELARFVATTQADAIPPEVRHDAKRILLDGLGCALGGYSMTAGRISIDGLRRWRVSDEKGATVVGDGVRMPSVHAAYLNARLSNLMDMDEVILNIGHLSPAVQWSALALAEEEGLSGADLLTAFTLGFEVGSRVFLALGTIFEIQDGRAVPADTTGFGHAVVGGAAACGRLLRLSPEKMINALALGAMHTPAPLSHTSVTNMSMAKYQMDSAAAGAVLGALLAASGQTGPDAILDNANYAHAMARKRFDPEPLTKGLGEEWHVGLTSIKPYPHCRHTHYALDLVSRIVREKSLTADAIDNIHVEGFASFGVPPWNNYHPASPFEVQFSLPYGVAMAAAGIPPGPEWMREERLADPVVAQLAQRVTSAPHPEIQERIVAAWPDPLTEVPTRVTITARGAKVTATDTFASGDGFAPTHRLSDDTLIAKFRRNAEPVLAPDAIDGLIDAVFDLDREGSLSALTRLMKSSSFQKPQ